MNPIEMMDTVLWQNTMVGLSLLLSIMTAWAISDGARDDS